MVRPSRPTRPSGAFPDNLDRPGHWTARAACREGVDPDIFFPPRYDGAHTQDVAAAKQICARCPVIGPCLNSALRHRERDGIWGALIPEERDGLVRRPARDPVEGGEERARPPAVTKA